MAQLLAARRLRTQPKETATAVRRIGRTRAAAAAPTATKPKEKADIDGILKLIAEADTELRELTTKREGLVAQLQAAFEAEGIEVGQEMIAHGYRAAIEETKSRASTDINPKDLYDFMTKMKKGAEFWEAVSVQITNLKKLITEREYGKLKKVETPSKVTGQKLVVEPIKVKGRK